MTGLTSIRLQPSTPTLTPPATAARPARHLPSSSSSCTALSRSLFSKRAAGRGRAGAVAPVARYGRGGGGGGGGFRPGLDRGRRSSGPPTGSDSDDEALDFTGITSRSVRLIDEQQNMIGVVSLEEAIQRAEDAELDLVILSADADPPVLRIVDYKY